MEIFGVSHHLVNPHLESYVEYKRYGMPTSLSCGHALQLTSKRKALFKVDLQNMLIHQESKWTPTLSRIL